MHQDSKLGEKEDRRRRKKTDRAGDPVDYDYGGDDTAEKVAATI